MLFYVKKYWWLELLVTAVLAGLGLGGIYYFNIQINAPPSLSVLALGAAWAAGLTIWTFAVQGGYALFRGHKYADELTRSLAKEYAGASYLQAFMGGMTAALGEEVFFRGFVQNQWGIWAGVLLFGLAHFGKKDIRVVSGWSFMHGLIIGLSYHYSGNLLVPMIAHGGFDLGGVIYFKLIMRKAPK